MEETGKSVELLREVVGKLSAFCNHLRDLGILGEGCFVQDGKIHVPGDQSLAGAIM